MVAIDEELMAVEREIDDAWKIILNVTEFLTTRDPEWFFWSLEKHGWSAYEIRGIVMMDPPNISYPAPDHQQLLVTQRWHGFFEDEKKCCPEITHLERSRLLHCLPDGGYHGGRHVTLRMSYIHPHGAIIIHFKYSPWTKEFIERKLFVKERLSPEDIQNEHGRQHLWSVPQMEEKRAYESQIVMDLREHPVYRRIVVGLDEQLMMPTPRSTHYPMTGLVYNTSESVDAYQMVLKLIGLSVGDFISIRQHQAEKVCHNELDRGNNRNVFLMLLASVKFFQNEFAEAERLLQEILSTDPDNAYCHFNYSVVLLLMGRREESDQHWQKSVMLNPTFTQYLRENGSFALCG
ncbi:MAG: tetratricopeptide repeat protein [Magnetococcales bacterium]|nr:tetratricopeptide repeat protein [Magnetococcales bacterium]